MEERRFAAVVRVVRVLRVLRVRRVLRALPVVVAVLVLGACRQPVGSVPGGAGGGPQDSPVPSGYGVEFLGPGDCSSRGEVFREVSCGSERAAARVLARYTGTRADGPACPPATDFVLHISAQGGDPEPSGYACMRNLESPHPGDPGQGGGPLTVVGDCVHGSREGEVRETACDGSGERKPEFVIGSAVARRALCPDTTDLYVELGGEKPVGCARRM
ncbi:hypothetical protein [Streptomyces sp. NBC_01012]|uniref:hypothetical protein n=1 Tax=Streptomyces sp. NBC_01012 TaxID=2903717 RepID=UPI0038659AC8|nr:hypothetical protein OG623_23085 [Streptomyces sp. NBC_01012]